MSLGMVVGMVVGESNLGKDDDVENKKESQQNDIVRFGTHGGEVFEKKES